jgi:hypothetical protein
MVANLSEEGRQKCFSIDLYTYGLKVMRVVISIVLLCLLSNYALAGQTPLVFTATALRFYPR